MNSYWTDILSNREDRKVQDLENYGDFENYTNLEDTDKADILKKIKSEYRSLKTIEDKTALIKYIFEPIRISTSTSLMPNDSYWRSENVELFTDFISKLIPKLKQEYIEEFKNICKEELVWIRSVSYTETKYSPIIDDIGNDKLTKKSPSKGK